LVVKQGDTCCYITTVLGQRVAINGHIIFTGVNDANLQCIP
jgi:hypothetical protein